MANAHPESRNSNSVPRKNSVPPTSQNQSRAKSQTANSSRSASSAAPPKPARAASTDRERAISTGREGAASRTASPLGQSSQVRGGAQPPLTPSHHSMMRRIADDMDRAFHDLALGRDVWRQSVGLPSVDNQGDTWARPSNISQGAWSPTVETFRRDDKVVVRAELPGLKKEDVKVHADNGVLTISGERCDENEDTRDGYYHSERSYGQFYRAVPLPQGVDASHCDASFRDGVLEVSFAAPKSDQRATQVKIR